MTVQTDSFCFSSLLLGRNTRCDVLGLMTDPIDCNLSYLMVSFFFFSHAVAVCYNWSTKMHLYGIHTVAFSQYCLLTLYIVRYLLSPWLLPFDFP